MPVYVIIWLGIVTLWLIVVTFLLLTRRNHPQAPVQLSSGANLTFGLVKYNPFPDTGGDQSFTLSLLDRVGNGILLTSLHARGTTRLYIKRVHQGKTDQELSAEEKHALTQSLTYEKK